MLLRNHFNVRSFKVKARKKEIITRESYTCAQGEEETLAMSRDLIDESSSKGQILTAVIPVANLYTNFENLKKTIESATEFGIRVITVIDLAAQNDSGLDLCIEEISNLSSHGLLKVTQGSFGNPGSARNFGKSLSETQWVTFWDADDHPNCSTIARSLRNHSNEADAIIGNYETLNSKSCRKVTSSSLVDIGINPGFWRILFRLEAIKNVEFPPLRMGEDQLFLVRCHLERLRTVFTNDVFYRYNIINENRLSNDPLALRELASAIRLLENEVNIHETSEYIKIINFRLKISQIKTAINSREKLIAFLSLPWNIIFSKLFLRIIRKLNE